MDVHVVKLVAHNRHQVTSLRVREPESYPRVAQCLTLQKKPRVLEVWAHFFTMAVFFFVESIYFFLILNPFYQISVGGEGYCLRLVTFNDTHTHTL